IPEHDLAEAVQALINERTKYRQAFNYGGPKGSPNLTASILAFQERLGIGGLDHDVLQRQQVIIGPNGATSLLEGLADLLEPGIVVTSDPMYYIYCNFLERKGYELLTVPEDDNGLRPDIWNAFKTRFQIPAILEFYAATESNVALINFDGQPGAVGRIPFYLRKKLVTEVIRFDIEAAEAVRGANGRCIRAADNEVGEVIGKVINDPNRPAQRFEGYADKKETEKKILRDVFEDGDVWFRTGDLMRRDGRGYFYFVDRVGDTFRWKGENVATSEVAETLTVFPGVREANVYGVKVPGHDGRAGMAVLVVDADFDLAALHRYIGENLPDYARPLFLRLRKDVEVTTTFKQKKVDLVREGFDPHDIADPIYFDDHGAQAYRRMDAALHARIAAGEIRL
ncbi:MAG TPA: AMP-binding protein, partial [Hyphomicrobiales bacterium]|nr:AMP-binding protein [Hyphomicrobiales bacterium]